MFPAAVRLLPIKDLEDLRALLPSNSIDMQVLTDLKRCFSRARVFLSVGRGPVPRQALGTRALITSVEQERLLLRRFTAHPQASPNYRDEKFAGDRPPRYGSGKGSPLAPFYRGGGRSRTTDGRSVFAQVGRSRGTGPRATVDGAASYNLANLANLVRVTIRKTRSS